MNNNDSQDANNSITTNSNMIYIMNIELQKGITKQLKIYSDSNSAEIAYYFCKENDLDFSSLNQLVVQIENLQSKFAIEEEEEEENYSSNNTNNTHNTLQNNSQNNNQKENENENVNLNSKIKTFLGINNDNKSIAKKNNIKKFQSPQIQLFPNELLSQNNVHLSSKSPISTLYQNQNLTFRRKSPSPKINNNRNKIFICNNNNLMNKKTSYQKIKNDYYKFKSSFNNNSTSKQKNTQSHSNKNMIFNRLFKEAQLKRLSPSNTSRYFKEFLSGSNSKNTSLMGTSSYNNNFMINSNSHRNIKEQILQKILQRDKSRELIRALSEEFIKYASHNKNKILKKSKSSSNENALKGIRKEAINQLFNELTKDEKKEQLNKDTLIISSIPKNILPIIKIIIDKIKDCDKIYTRESFIKEILQMFSNKEISFDEKRTIVSHYYNRKNKINNRQKPKVSLINTSGKIKRKSSNYFSNYQPLSFKN